MIRLNGSFNQLSTIFSDHIIHELLQPFVNRSNQDTPPLGTEDQMLDKKIDARMSWIFCREISLNWFRKGSWMEIGYALTPVFSLAGLWHTRFRFPPG
jgi:hypothetical protein